MAQKLIIISGGEFCPLDDVSAGAFIIACDRGYEYARRCGIKPDLVVGDFDSYSGAVDAGVDIDRYYSEKDDTDTMIAVRYAVEQGYEELELRCALGGRLDHTLANIQSAAFAAKRGLKVKLLDSRTLIYTMNPGLMRLRRREGYSLSLFSLTEQSTGVYIRGAKYPLENATVTNAFPIGVSNEWKSEEAEIELGSGMLLIVMSKL